MATGVPSAINTFGGTNYNLGGGGFGGGFGSGFSGGLGFNTGFNMFGNTFTPNNLDLTNMNSISNIDVTSQAANLSTDAAGNIGDLSTNMQPKTAIDNVSASTIKTPQTSSFSAEVGAPSVYGKINDTGAMGWGSPESMAPGSVTGAVSWDANNNASLVGNYGQNNTAGSAYNPSTSSSAVNNVTGNLEQINNRAQGMAGQQGTGGGFNWQDALNAVGGLAQMWMQYKAMNETIKQNEHKLRAADIANQNARERSKSVNRQLSGKKDYKTSGKDFPEYKG
jgi:hypothetical protein